MGSASDDAKIITKMPSTRKHVRHGAVWSSTLHSA